MNAKNEYGLTFEEWSAAATFGVKDKRFTLDQWQAFRDAWRFSEDPTDWAHALALKESQEARA